ncbi:hypothetical protein C463_05750 [Halorubrum californiense DSM 19288]|uniref:Uncharacterized protein n=1 Tax=Halorubrum californiense DSM 19288 TaxID=1227465 RepID=M0EDT8_9EURY|nr:hypothetical protein C463_05750 [Halorubrum californiense DSM 19288]
MEELMRRDSRQKIRSHVTTLLHRRWQILRNQRLIQSPLTSFESHLPKSLVPMGKKTKKLM